MNPAGLDALLAAAVRGAGIDPEAEGRALAAFRAARDEGAHRPAARARRRDDWRPERERRRGWSLRATLVGLVASVTLGGVAVAAIGGGGARDESGERRGPLPASIASKGATTTAPGSSAPAPAGDPSGRPPSARDTEAHCRSYDSVKGRGKALDSTAWQRLARAAGGEKNIRAYCAERLAEARNEKEEGTGADKGSSRKSPKASKAPGQGATKKAENAEKAESTKGAKAAKNKDG